MRIRRLLQRLVDLDVLFEYRLNPYAGQSLHILCEDGLVHRMTLGTAKSYADRLEAKKWGFIT